eukprot:TRINITY_DN588_c0_g2_i1.p1 TRINITY_DN588_c0_g2~~TRINITY_DN588_c0_g2_i1.p1  ORF type:complete len:277 (-),score=60.28 TRINITY_DN588_c0_g2_i1:78-908(-)
MMLAVDSSGCLTHWSEEAERLSSFTQAEVVGLPLLEFITCPFREQVNVVMSKVRKGLASDAVHLPFYGKSGCGVDIVLQACQADVEGHITFKCALREDPSSIFPEKANSHSPGEAIKSTSMLMTLDEQGRVIDWNDVAEEYSLFLRSEVLGLQFAELLTTPVREEVCQMIQQATLSKESPRLQAPFYTKAAEKLDVIFNAYVSSGNVVVECKVNDAEPSLACASCGSRSEKKANLETCETTDTLGSLGFPGANTEASLPSMDAIDETSSHAFETLL